jgi:hypothetical protein
MEMLDWCVSKSERSTFSTIEEQCPDSRYICVSDVRIEKVSDSEDHNRLPLSFDKSASTFRNLIESTDRFT